MKRNERLKKIKQYMSEHKEAEIDAFKAFLDVSESTIRRDVKVLVQQGILTEHHGSVELIEKNITDTFINQRLNENIEIKDTIGKKAAQLIPDEGFIYIDAGSTTFHMIKHIHAKNLTVCTNGLNIAIELAKYGIETMMVKGNVKPTTLAVVGEEAIDAIANFNFDMAFMGTNGVSSKGYSTPDIKEGLLKKRVIQKSRQSFVLSDGSKFNRTTAYIFAEADECRLISDKDVGGRFI